MLYLTRFPGEAIRIGEHIRLLVRQVRGRRVTIGIEAPREVVVDREEIFERKRPANRSRT